MTRPPTKADLEAAVGRLTAENAALRDLLAAVRETAQAGSTVHGDGSQHWLPAWWAASRIASWLDDASERDATGITGTAALFRGHVTDIAGMVRSPAPDGYVTSEEAARHVAARLAARPGDGEPAGLEDAAAQDENEAGDPFMRPAPGGMQDPAPVVRVLDDGEPPCGLRTWGDVELCELPAGHDPLPSCSGKPRPFMRTAADPSGGPLPRRVPAATPGGATARTGGE